MRNEKGGIPYSITKNRQKSDPLMRRGRRSRYGATNNDTLLIPEAMTTPFLETTLTRMRYE